MAKNLPANAGRRGERPGFDPWVRKMLWRRAWQCTPVFLPGKCHGQRSLAGCSPWGRKELDLIEQLTLARRGTPIMSVQREKRNRQKIQPEDPNMEEMRQRTASRGKYSSKATSDCPTRSYCI